MTIENYIDSDLIHFLDANSRDNAIEILINSAKKAGKLQDAQAFSEAVHQREKIVSTGIGLGIAIPHARLDNVEDFFIVVGIQQGPGLSWDSLDHTPVRMIFLIGGPASKQTEYLKILSELTRTVKQEKLRKTLLTAKTAEEIVSLFNQELQSPT